MLKISLWIPQDACEEYVKNNDEDLQYKKKLGLKHQCLIRQFSHHQGKHPLFKQKISTTNRRTLRLTVLDECLSRNARLGAVPAGITVDTHAR